MFFLLITTTLAADELLPVAICKMSFIQAIPFMNMVLILLQFITPWVLHTYTCQHLVLMTQFSHNLYLFNLALKLWFIQCFLTSSGPHLA